MTHSTSSSTYISIPPQLILRATKNSDVLDFWSRWQCHRPKDKRRQWAYVYIASKEANFRWPTGGASLVKIGASIRPWNRVREICAKSIIFSRWVYRPFILEKGLHSHYREYGEWDINYRAKHGDDAYIRDEGAFVRDEWFVLPETHLNDAMRIIDFWQLASPLADDDASRPAWSWANPYTGSGENKRIYHFDYDSDVALNSEPSFWRPQQWRG